MANLDQIKVRKTNTIYDIEDSTARTAISGINEKIPSGASSSDQLVKSSDLGTAAGKDSTSSVTAGSTDLVESGAVKDAIDSALSSAYKPAGTKTCAELTNALLVAANRGNVYNMTDAGTTTADFLEGAGKPIRVGDNVGICEPTSGTFKFDLLSGFIAVDENPTASSANPVSSGGVKTALDGKVDKVTGKGLSTNDYTNTDKAVVTTAQDNIKANTKLIKDTVGFSGKNLCNTDIVLNLYMDTANNKYAANNTAHLCVAKVKPSTKYIVTKQAGTQFRIASSQNYPADNVAYSQTIANHTGTEIEITTGASDNYIGVYTTETDMPTVMLRDANILDDTYEPYHPSVVNTLRDAEVIEGKNLLPYHSGYTIAGNTFYADNNGYMSCAQNDIRAWEYASCNEFLTLKAGTYKFKGYQKTARTDKYIGAGIFKSDGTSIKDYYSGTQFNNLIANGDTFTLTQDTNIGVEYKLGNGSFAFMITPNDETFDYEPYFKDVLKDSMFRRDEQRVLGAKNLLPNYGVSKEENGLTFTVNSDGSVTIDGTSTAVTSLSMVQQNKNFAPSANKYMFSKGNSNTDIEMYINKFNDSTYVSTITLFNTNGIYDIDYNGYNKIVIGITIQANKTIDNETVYPMMCLATDLDDIYVPYAMTNRKLTDSAFIPRDILSNANDLNNCTKSGIYYIDNAKPSNFPNFLLESGETVLRICLLVFTFNMGSQQFCYQVLYRGSNGKLAFRVKYMTSGNWEAWKGIAMNLT